MSPTSRDTSRRLVLAAGAGLGLSALAACGGGSGGGDLDLPDEIPTDTSAEITYAIWDQAQRPAMDEIIAAFNEEYPDVTVNVSVTPFQQYWQKLQTQASGGDLPDVFWMNGPHVQLYAAEGMLADIAQVPGIDPANYPDAMNQLYTYEDAQWGVPKDFDTIGLWWNADIFSRAGVEEPTADWTWADYEDTSRRITEALGAEGIWGNPGGVENQAYLYPLIHQAGGYIVSEDGTTSGYDEPASIEAFSFVKGMVDDGIAPPIEFSTENVPQDVFSSGRAGMFWSGNWNAAVFKDSPVRDDIRASPLPQGSQPGNVIHGIAHVMSAGTANPEASAAFLAFLGSERANVIQAEAGAANPAFTGTNDAYVASLPEFDLQIFIDAAETASPYPVSRNTSAWLSVETELYPQILGGTVPLEEGLADLATRMDEALADEQ